MEETTTEAATQDDQAQQGQPVEQPAEAVQTDPSEPTPTDQDEQEPTEVDNSAESEESKSFTPEWLQSKGIDPNDPEAFQKVANMAYNAEKQMTKTQQKASELQKQIQQAPQHQVSDDPAVQEAYRIANEARTTVAVEQWKQAKGITPAQDQQMGDWLLANPTKAELYKNGHLTLDDLFAMSGVGAKDEAAIEAQASQKALEQLANKQRAASVPGSASNTQVEKGDPILDVLLSD